MSSKKLMEMKSVVDIVSLYFGTRLSIYENAYVPHAVEEEEGNRIVIQINDKFSLSFSLKRTNNWFRQNYYVLEYSYVIDRTKISHQKCHIISLCSIVRGDEFNITHSRQFKYNNLDQIHEKVHHVIADFEKVIQIVYPDVSGLF
jgi:hypothetical protein